MGAEVRWQVHRKMCELYSLLSDRGWDLLDLMEEPPLFRESLHWVGELKSWLRRSCAELPGMPREVKSYTLALHQGLKGCDLPGAQVALDDLQEFVEEWLDNYNPTDEEIAYAIERLLEREQG